MLITNRRYAITFLIMAARIQEERSNTMKTGKILTQKTKLVELKILRKDICSN